MDQHYYTVSVNQKKVSKLNDVSDKRELQYVEFETFFDIKRKFKQLRQINFIQTTSIAPLQVHYYSESFPTQHGYCAGISRRSAIGKCELRTCLRSHARGGQSGSRTHDPLDERHRLFQCPTHASYINVWNTRLK